MMEKAVKVIVFSLLILLSAVILTWTIWRYRLFYEWLEPRHIEGLVLMVVLSFGLTALFIPFVVMQDWAKSSAKAVAQNYLASFGLMFMALTAVFFLLWLLGLSLELLRRYPIILFVLAGMSLLLPLIVYRVRKYLSEGEGKN